MSAEAQSWKLTLPCTRAEAEAIDAGMDALPMLDPPPVLMTTEGVEDDPLSWRLDAYFEDEPDAAAVAAVRALVPSAAGADAVPAPVAEQDWVTLSQAGLAPISIGRFHVHTSADPGEAQPGQRRFLIEAGLAFGTGQHETTAGCLAMLDTLEREGVAARHIIDLGTGTGLLAFAALHLWPQAEATATDIDPVAIAVTQQNARANAVTIGETQGAVALVVADGTRDETIAARGPYDLVIANILAQPLIDMAPDIARIAAPGAALVLAGLLTVQADAVEAAFAATGFAPVQRSPRGDWTILRLRRAGDQPSPAS